MKKILFIAFLTLSTFLYAQKQSIYNIYKVKKIENDKESIDPCDWKFIFSNNELTILTSKGYSKSKIFYTKKVGNKIIYGGDNNTVITYDSDVKIFVFENTKRMKGAKLIYYVESFTK